MQSLVNQAVNKLQANPYFYDGISVGLSPQFANSDAFKLQNYVSAQERAAAEKQMAFQEEQSAKAMAFNSAEAAKNRDWQKMMSDSAHQREVVDLIAAGLNPVLSVSGGNGASSPSGATASGNTSAAGSKANVDNSAMQVLATEVSKLMERQTQTDITNRQLENQLDIAKMQISMNEFLGLLNADTSRYAASTSAWASKYVADMSYQTQMDNPRNALFKLLGTVLAPVFESLSSGRSEAGKSGSNHPWFDDSGNRTGKGDFDFFQWFFSQGSSPYRRGHALDNLSWY